MNPRSTEIAAPGALTSDHKTTQRRKTRKSLRVRVMRSPFIVIGHTRGIRYIAPGVRAFDEFLYRRNRGRVTSVGLAGLHSLLLLVEGRRTGKQYRVPLLCLPWAGGYVVVGSNWGGPKHPEWVANLMVVPNVSVNYRGQVQLVRSRLLEGPDREIVWPQLVESWPAYQSYADRLDRELPVFLLEPVEESPERQPNTPVDAVVTR
jgi:deazaflavin-dependent oxidoreductase (nitroreductase family)